MANVEVTVIVIDSVSLIDHYITELRSLLQRPIVGFDVKFGTDDFKTDTKIAKLLIFYVENHCLFIQLDRLASVLGCLKDFLGDETIFFVGTYMDDKTDIKNKVKCILRYDILCGTGVEVGDLVARVLKTEKFSTRERDPPIDKVIKAGVVPYLVTFIGRNDLPQLQFEAAWALTNIESGISKHTRAVVDANDANAVPTFVNILRSSLCSDDLKEQKEVRVLRCWAQGCEANYDMDCSDALAIYKGLSVGRDMRLMNFIVETDSENVKQIVNGVNSDANHGGILDSIQSIVSDFEKVDFNFVPSKADRVALALANEALRLKDVAEWKEDAPMCIRALVEDEQRS
ncbi:hypothetical protein LWI28_021225 [Acer negundo]|uniref:RNase H type-1 domain-containing protein n=1 Tax=Acer negundo TaxID=4023 RepID=A0AAD5NWB4_ACENE|nr:hypothetical protein LWI28_021225 [Acer negundo]